MECSSSTRWVSTQGKTTKERGALLLISEVPPGGSEGLGVGVKNSLSQSPVRTLYPLLSVRKGVFAYLPWRDPLRRVWIEVLS